MNQPIQKITGLNISIGLVSGSLVYQRVKGPIFRENTKAQFISI